MVINVIRYESVISQSQSKSSFRAYGVYILYRRCKCYCHRTNRLLLKIRHITLVSSVHILILNVASATATVQIGYYWKLDTKHLQHSNSFIFRNFEGLLTSLRIPFVRKTRRILQRGDHLFSSALYNTSWIHLVYSPDLEFFRLDEKRLGFFSPELPTNVVWVYMRLESPSSLLSYGAVP